MRLHAGQTRAHDFSIAPQANIPRSSFNRSHGHKTTFNAGYLVPIFVDEVLPGDTFNLKMTAFARMATPIFPIMDNLYMDSFFFFVPYRIVWDHWEQFNGQQANPADSTNYVMPTITSTVGTGYVTGSLFDYFGIPTKVAGIVTQSLPLRAYNLIYNEWFRDENLQNSVTVEIDDGPDTVGNYSLLQRGKRYDYFTSCLPWPQKINDGTVVTLPLGTVAPVIGFGKQTQNFSTGPTTVYESTGTTASYGFFTNTSAAVADNTWLAKGTAATGGYPAVFADLAAATSATINQLRQAFQLQKLFERDARGGTRYVEIIKSHFGVIDPMDYVLMRPVYLGGGSSIVNFHVVPQTSGTSITGESTPQANLSAFGTATLNGHGFTKSFTEHGVVIGLVSVRADYTYQQGCERFWFRSTRYDHYWPALSHIGEQAVLNQEVYTQGTAGGSADVGVFGYQERYAEYRYKPSRISGYFRSNATGTLDPWHLSQKFSSLPTLGSTFIVENPPMSRVEAVTSVSDFIFDSYFDYKCARPMPVYSVPGLIDHF